jgi:hypothetical protein
MTPIEWCRKNDIWYLKIDLEIPEVFIEEAQKVYDEGFFVPHRIHDGAEWWSAAIYGFVHEDESDISLGWRHTMNPTGHHYTDETVKWGWTEVAEVAPEMKRWLENFPHKHYRRCRYMLIKPGGSIIAHHDANDDRINEGRKRNISAAINLAIYQPDNCYLRRVDTKEELPFENCTGFWFDNGVTHEGLNSSDENRFHFIIHGGSNKERVALMKRSMVKQFGKNVLRELDT